MAADLAGRLIDRYGSVQQAADRVHRDAMAFRPMTGGRIFLLKVYEHIIARYPVLP